MRIPRNISGADRDETPVYHVNAAANVHRLSLDVDGDVMIGDNECVGGDIGDVNVTLEQRCTSGAGDGECSVCADELSVTEIADVRTSVQTVHGSRGQLIVLMILSVDGTHCNTNQRS